MPFGPSIGGIIFAAFTSVTFLPSLAVAARRVHNTNRRAWWILAPVAVFATAFLVLVLSILAGWDSVILSVALVLSPIVGLLAPLMLLCLQGSRSPNWFGPDLKDPAAGADLDEVFR